MALAGRHDIYQGRVLELENDLKSNAHVVSSIDFMRQSPMV